MKKTILSFGLWILCGLADMEAQTAQDSTLVTSKDKHTLQVDKLYAGLYGIGTIDSAALQSGKVGTFANIRVGWLASRRMDKLTAKAWLAYDKTVGQQDQIFSLFGLSYQPCKATTFDVGKIPSAATHMVAPPVTAWWHFLFTAETKVPGAGLAVKATQKLGDVTVIWSATQTSDGVKPSAYVSVDNEIVWSLSAASMYTPDGKEFAWWISWNKTFHNRSSIFAILWADPRSFAYSAMFTTKNDIGIFVDGSYDFQQGIIPATQVGILKAVDWFVNAKLGAGYDPINHRLQWVLFLNMSK